MHTGKIPKLYIRQGNGTTDDDPCGNRVATKVNDEWRFMVYDAFGKMVAEYGNEEPDITSGLKFVHQDWQGSVRTITNRNGYVISRTDHQAFGATIGAGVGDRNTAQGYIPDQSVRQGYARTEIDESTGYNHAWFRKLENSAGRWTSPDPYKGSMSVNDPQSFNRYSYVTNDPINSIDPSGLYAICVHEAMTAILGRLAGLGDKVADALAGFAGGKPGGADSELYAATSIGNIEQCRRGEGPSVTIHFPSAAQLQANIEAYPGFMALGEAGYQQAGHMLHSIQDSLGAHNGYSNSHCQGHALAGHAPDLLIGDEKFLAAALKVFQVMKNDPNATLNNSQINALIAGIQQVCAITEPKSTLTIIPVAIGGGAGGGGSAGGGGYVWGYGYSWHQNSTSSFLYWLYSIEVGQGSVTIDTCVGSECPPNI